MLTPLARRWLGVVTIALGLVAMHSLVAASCHDGARAAMSQAATSQPAASHAEGYQGWTDTEAAGTGCAAGHACQATRADSTPLPDPGGVAVGAVAVVSPAPRVRPLAAALTGRAPPDHGARLAQLSVWRN